MPENKLNKCHDNSLRAFSFLKSATYLMIVIKSLQRIADYYQNRFITRRTLQTVLKKGLAAKICEKTEERVRISICFR